MAEHCVDSKDTCHFPTNSVDECIKKYDFHNISLLTGLPEGDTKVFLKPSNNFRFQSNHGRLVFCFSHHLDSCIVSSWALTALETLLKKMDLL